MQTRTNIKVLPHQTDEALLAAYQATSDLEPLAVLYKRYMGLVFAICLKYLKTTPASEDAVMDIFEHLVEKVKVHDITHFKAWLGAVARNHCLMQLRKQKQGELGIISLDGEFMQSGDAMHLNGNGLEETGWISTETDEKELMLSSMETCLDTLVAQQKTCVSLFYLQQKCYKEVANITGFAIEKVRSYIQNGRRNLKICMEKQHSDQ